TMPQYDRYHLEQGIMRIGVGGFHRARLAVYNEDLFNQGQDLEWGIYGVGLLSHDVAIRAPQTHALIINRQNLLSKVFLVALALRALSNAATVSFAFVVLFAIRAKNRLCEIITPTVTTNNRDHILRPQYRPTLSQ
ncbi:MAG: hypothetical protein EOO38_30700, partial [Cytophagaceae bacterium]